MSDISVSERRLSAALDRIDQFLDRGGLVRQGQAPDLGAELAAAQAQIAELTARLERERPDSQMANLAEQAARLAAANDDLAAANRALIQAASGEGDLTESVTVALESEIEALRAARAAEAAQLGILMSEVERLLAGAGAAPDAATPEIAGDAGGVPETDNQVSEGEQ